jgi:hypothetical protein
MKIVELLTGINQPVTNEEYTLYRSFATDVKRYKRDLNERDQHVANQLVIKDLLVRINEDGKILYKKKNR